MSEKKRRAGATAAGAASSSKKPRAAASYAESLRSKLRPDASILATLRSLASASSSNPRPPGSPSRTTTPRRTPPPRTSWWPTRTPPSPPASTASFSPPCAASSPLRPRLLLRGALSQRLDLAGHRGELVWVAAHDEEAEPGGDEEEGDGAAPSSPRSRGVLARGWPAPLLAAVEPDPGGERGGEAPGGGERGGAPVEGKRECDGCWRHDFE